MQLSSSKIIGFVLKTGGNDVLGHNIDDQV